MPWFVLYTKSRAEKKVADSLERMGIESYCPTTTELRQWSDRKKKVNVPLFSLYVFVYLKENERKKVFEVPGVIKYLYWLGKPAIVRDVEINTIKEWLGENHIEEASVEGLTPGDKLIITNGGFKDQEAIIRDIGPNRIRLLLTGMGCTLSLRIREVL